MQITSVVLCGLVLAGCGKSESKKNGGGGGGDKVKSSAAVLGLQQLEKSLQVAFAQDAEFPIGDAPLTPATACCDSPNQKCAVAPALWQSEVWSKLDFSVDQPSYFRFAYHSDGKTATAIASGDLDCDGTSAEFKLTATVVEGVPRFELTKPATPD